MSYHNPKTKKYREDKIYKLTNKEGIVFTDIESEFMLILDIYDPNGPVFVSQVIKTYRRK
ncbi:hypothetical protein [Myroides sp. LoEW2-1]|uniref:hypothetical protein n=1 Tax=Myroides sp. LoEW2-1 TaxID=2683192 RepID=UPI001324FA9E|nr:hypothetical protein [Myroides sp. LoEW2-1]MVX36089.1 hypothetical protein [Myroides sp. LoEW2-1]